LWVRGDYDFKNNIFDIVSIFPACFFGIGGSIADLYNTGLLLVDGFWDNYHVYVKYKHVEAG